MDLRSVGVDFLTIGQYLQPTKKHLKVDSFVRPEVFEMYREEGENLGLNMLQVDLWFDLHTKRGSFLSESIFKK